LQSLAQRMAYSDGKLERFLVLNGLQTNSALSAGQKVKIVTY
jgi:predicted Zn-dependent protease